jgi:hypothetical protein
MNRRNHKNNTMDIFQQFIIKVQGISSPHGEDCWSTSFSLLPCTQDLLPVQGTCSEHTLEILCCKCPTTASSFLAATVYTDSYQFYFLFFVELKHPPKLLIDMIALNIAWLLRRQFSCCTTFPDHSCKFYKLLINFYGMVGPRILSHTKNTYTKVFSIKICQSTVTYLHELVDKYQNHKPNSMHICKHQFRDNLSI